MRWLKRAATTSALEACIAEQVECATRCLFAWAPAAMALVAKGGAAASATSVSVANASVLDDLMGTPSAIWLLGNRQSPSSIGRADYLIGSRHGSRVMDASVKRAGFDRIGRAK
ncbi:MAG TPA: hypothetical protein VKX28_04095 [Xanthobacteraceae bacterium]|nr:hypothetical protein [Xanthobacteraceae bacterium]